jgi:protein TonB
MEKQDQNIRSWDDLIFENRNKEYGAYALRQDYSARLLKGVITSIGFAVAIFVVAGFINGKSVLPTKLPGDLIFEPGTPPNIKADIIPSAPREKPARNINRELPPQVVTTPDPVEPKPEPASTSTGTEGTTDGTATPDTGTSGSFSTGTDLGTVDVKSNEPFIHVEIMPVYKGGMEGMMKTLKKNMRYPASARRMGKEGTVYVEFVVSDEGEIINTKVIRGFDVDCDKEAVRMVEKLTEWTPGLQNKIAVNVRMVLPIKFKLEQ